MRRKNGMLFFLAVLKEQQDQLKGLKTDICSSLLAKLLDADTIPVMIQIGSDYFEASGTTNGCSFTTKCFRIEAINKEKRTVTLSLLKPLDVCGDVTACFCDLYRLEKTKTCVMICIDRISGIQCVEMERMINKIVVEPKW